MACGEAFVFVVKDISIILKPACVSASVCLSVSRLKGFWMWACRKLQKVQKIVKKFTEGHVTIFEEFGA